MRPAAFSDAGAGADGGFRARGEFASELGEDFWGLRELGLDAELGMGSLRIPSRLYHGRSKQGTGSDDPDASVHCPAPCPDRPSDGSLHRTGPAKEPRWFVPPAFVPLTPAAIEGQIGLLQPFFRARLENADFRLLEDHEIPKGKAPKLVRPKVPPSGKIPIRRKQAEAMAKSASDEGGVNVGTPGKKRKKVD